MFDEINDSNTENNESIEPIIPDNPSTNDDLNTENITANNSKDNKDEHISPKEPKKIKLKSLKKKKNTSAILSLVLAIVAIGSSIFNTATISELNKNLTTVKNAQTESTISPISTTNNVQDVSYVENSNNLDIPSIVKQTMPSIVSITNKTTYTYQSFFNGPQTQEVEGSGTGVIITDSTKYIYIVTNYHVVEGADTLSITFVDEKTSTAEVVDYDEDMDIAIVKVEKEKLSQDTLNSIKKITIGNSSDIELGESAVAIGNALGYGQSVTDGIISATNREIETETTDPNDDFYSYFFEGQTSKVKTKTLIQTNAAINPGNSGGALLNSKGELIGINSSKYASVDVEGVGYAIPIDSIKEFIDNTLNEAAIEETTPKNNNHLGITGWNVTSDIAEQYNIRQGVCVQSVEEDSPAAKYGIQKGDIIFKFNGKDITTIKELQKEIKSVDSNSTVKVSVQRKVENLYTEQDLEVIIN